MKGLKSICFYAVILLALIIGVSVFFGQTSQKRMKYSEVIDYFKEGKVAQFTIKDSVLEFAFTEDIKDGKAQKTQTFSLYSPSWFMDEIMPYVEEQKSAGTLLWYDLVPATPTPFWVSFIPYLLFGAVIVFLGFFMVNQMNGGNSRAMNFGRAKLKMNVNSKKKITFADVAGAEEEKEEFTEIVEFLKNPSKFTEIGARIPRGVLLVGAPGTGKTYLAKAASGEAGVPFFSISGSDFVELYVGVGASRVRDTFEQAKKNSPCIVFIDEIDAVGRQRGAGLGGGHDEREQTLNQVLVEMDGFEENEGVIVMAATNRPDILDNALLRPGRFDRQIVINLPDLKARKEILAVHMKNKKADPEIDLETVAKTTAGFAPADLENLLNEAALLAIRAGRKAINMQDIQDAIMKVELGIEKKTRTVSEKEKKLTAYHEAGHAIVGHKLGSHDDVHEISIIPRGMAGGYTYYKPKEDKSYHSKNEMLDRIVSLLGGRAAEDLCLDDISTGASNDIERATSIANKMITRYGMSEKLGPIVFGKDNEEVFLGRDFGTQKNYSDEVAFEIDQEIKSFIDQSYARAKEILTKNMEELHGVAKLLLEKEKITGQEFLQILGEKTEDSAEEEKTENKE